jgi:hypothetical protein
MVVLPLLTRLAPGLLVAGSAFAFPACASAPGAAEDAGGRTGNSSTLGTEADGALDAQEALVDSPIQPVDVALRNGNRPLTGAKVECSCTTTYSAQAKALGLPASAVQTVQRRSREARAGDLT